MAVIFVLFSFFVLSLFFLSLNGTIYLYKYSIIIVRCEDLLLGPQSKVQRGIKGDAFSEGM